MQGALAGDISAIIGLVSVAPVALAVIVVPEATNSNHMPLLFPPLKHVGGVSVPVMPVLS